MNQSFHQPAQETIAWQFIIKLNEACYLQDLDPPLQYLFTCYDAIKPLMNSPAPSKHLC